MRRGPGGRVAGQLADGGPARQLVTLVDPGDHRHLDDLRGVVAFVRPTHQLVAQAQREDDLGGRRRGRRCASGPSSHRCARGVGRTASCSLSAHARGASADIRTRPARAAADESRGRRRGTSGSASADRRRARPLVRGPARRAAGLPRAQRRGQDDHDAHDPRHHPARPRRDQRLRRAARASSTSRGWATCPRTAACTATCPSSTRSPTSGRCGAVARREPRGRATRRC